MSVTDDLFGLLSDIEKPQAAPLQAPSQFHHFAPQQPTTSGGFRTAPPIPVIPSAAPPQEATPEWQQSYDFLRQMEADYGYNIDAPAATKWMELEKIPEPLKLQVLDAEQQAYAGSKQVMQQRETQRGVTEAIRERAYDKDLAGNKNVTNLLLEERGIDKEKDFTAALMAIGLEQGKRDARFQKSKEYGEIDNPLARETFGAMQSAGSRVFATGAQVLGNEYTASELARLPEGFQAGAQEARKSDIGGDLWKYYSGGLGSVAEMMMAAPAGGAGVITTFAANESVQAYHEGLKAGKTKEQALNYAWDAGATEAAFASMFMALPGFRGAEQAIANAAAKQTTKAAREAFGTALAGELVEENLTEFTHNLNRAAHGIDPNAADWENQLQTAIDTSIQTTLITSASKGIEASGQIPNMLSEKAKNKSERKVAAAQMQAILEYVNDSDMKTAGEAFVKQPSRSNYDKAMEQFTRWQDTDEGQRVLSKTAEDQVESVLGPAEAPETPQEAPQQPQPTPEPQQQPEAVTEPPVQPESVPEPPTEQGQFEGVPADPAKAVDARVLQEEQNPPQQMSDVEQSMREYAASEFPKKKFKMPPEGTVVAEKTGYLEGGKSPVTVRLVSRGGKSKMSVEFYDAASGQHLSREFMKGKALEFGRQYGRAVLYGDISKEEISESKFTAYTGRWFKKVDEAKSAQLTEESNASHQRWVIEKSFDVFDSVPFTGAPATEEIVETTGTRRRDGEGQGLPQPEVIETTGTRRNPPQTVEVGAGKPPQSGLVVAAMGTDGKIYYGEPGQNHGALLKYAPVSEGVSNDTTLGGEQSMGFADSTGRFLSREEAAAVAGVTVPEAQGGKLDATQIPQAEPSQSVVQEEAKKPEKIRVVRGTPTRNWQDKNPETGDIWWFAVDDNPSAVDSVAKTFAAKSYTFADPDIDESLVAPTVTEADIEVTKSYEGTPEQEAELRSLLTANKAVQDEASGYKPIDEYVSETLNTWKTGHGDFSTATLNVLREQGYDSIRYPEDGLDTIGVLNPEAVKEVIKTHKVNIQTAQIEEQPYQTGQPITTRVVRLDNKKEGRTGRVFWTIGEDADLSNYQGDEVRGEVTLQNPFVVDGSQAELLRQIGRPEDADRIDARKVGIHKFDDEIKKEIASRGHDGIVYLDDTEQGAYQIVAFNPESVTEDEQTVADTEGETETQPPSNSYKVTKSDAGFTVTFGGQKPQTFKTEREARDAGKKMSREAFAKDKVDAIKADALAGRLKPVGTTQLMRIAKNMLKMAGTKYMLRALEGGYCGNHPLAKSLGKMNYSDTDNDVQITVRSDLEGARLTKDEVVAHEIGHAVDALNGEKRRTLDEMKGVPQGSGRARSYPVSLADRVAGRSTSTTKSGTKARKEQDAVIRSELESVAEKRNGEKLSRKAKSDSELIADFISAILTDPQMVMETAPESYKVFWENVDTRKAFFPAYAEFHSSEQQQEVQETTEKPVGDQVVPGFFVQKVGSRKWRLRDSSGFIDNTYPSRKKAVQAAKDAKSQISRTDPDKILPETTEQQPEAAPAPAEEQVAEKPVRKRKMVREAKAEEPKQKSAKQFKGAGVKGRGKRRSKATAELVKEYGVSEQDVDSAIEQASEYLQDEEDNRIRPLRRRILRSYKDHLTFRKIVKGDIQDAASLPGFDQVADTISEDVGFNQNMTGQQLYDWIRSLDIEYDTRNQTYNANHPRVIEEARKILDSATTTPTEQDEDIAFDPATFEDPESPYFMNTRGVGRGTREEVYGPEEEPSDPTPSTPPVTKGGKKLMNDLLRSKGNKSTRTLAGIRNIGEYMADLAHAIVLIGDSQTSKRSPAHYIWDERRKGAKKSPSVIRSRGPEGMFLFHEAGHALDIMLSSIKPKWWGKKDISEALIGLTHLPGSMASAKTRVEGIAEFIRLYIVDPGRIPTSLRNAMESNIAAVDPRIMQGVQDARRAYREWSSWDMGDALQSINRSGKKEAKGAQGITEAGWWAAYHIFGPNVAILRMKRKLWNPVLKTLGRYGRNLLEATENTTADIDAAYQSVVAVGREARFALYDNSGANRGLRVFSKDTNPFDSLDEDTVEALKEAGFELPEGDIRHGDYMYLTDYTFQDIRDSIGEDNWNTFETYGQYKAALERYRRAGHAFPGMFDKSPEDIQAWVEQIESENPLFKTEFKRVQKFFDQLLLTGMMSGEFSIPELINIKTKWNDYWPLIRKSDEGKGIGLGAPDSPSSGVRRAFGSHERFRSLNEAAEYRVNAALQAYYRLRAMQAMKDMAEVISENKSIPWETRTDAARVLLPLKADKKLAAKLSPLEEAQIVATALKNLQESGALQLEEDTEIDPQDILLSTPGGTQIFRGTKPKVVRVIRTFENGEHKYYQVTDDMLFDMLSHGTYVPSQIGQFAMKLVDSLLIKPIRPWKKLLTQNLPFAITNALSRDAALAMFMGKDGYKSVIPAYYMVRAAMNDALPASWLKKIGFDKYAPPQQGELLSQSMDATTHATHREYWERFIGELADGIYVKDWRNMPTSRKIAELPGILSSIVTKPFDMVNLFTFGKFASQKSETLNRNGAYYAALDRGASQERALMEYDKITGNFAHHQPTSGLALLVRQAGFLNAGLQITWGQMERWMQPSENVELGGTPVPYLSRNMTGLAARLPVLAIGGLLTAAFNHMIMRWFLDDDEYEEAVDDLRERKREHRLRGAVIFAPFVGNIRIPFDYGLPGAFQSFGYNMAEDYLLDKDSGSASDKAKELVAHVKESLPGLGDMLNPMMKTALETNIGETGYSFFYGEHIVPQYMVDNELDPAERSHPNTPELFKWIGKHTGTSPLKVQYVTRSLLTAAADDAAYVADKLADEKGIEARDFPSLRRLFDRPHVGFNSESVEVLSELDREWQLTSQKLKKAAERGESPSAIKELEDQKARLDRAHFAWELSEDLWKKAKEARLSGDMDAYEAHARDMTKLARSYVRWYESGKTGLTPTMAELATDESKTSIVYGALENLSTESDRDKSDENDWLISNRREMVKELGLTYEQSLELLNQKWLAEDQEAENKLAFKKGRDPKTIQIETRTEGRYAGAIRKLTDARVNRLKRLQEIYSNE